MDLDFHKCTWQILEQTLKKSKRRSITNMLREERKWNHIKCSIKTARGRRKVEDKNRKKEQG